MLKAVLILSVNLIQPCTDVGDYFFWINKKSHTGCFHPPKHSRFDSCVILWCSTAMKCCSAQDSCDGLLGHGTE